MQPTSPGAALGQLFALVVICGFGLLAFAAIVAIIKAKITKKRAGIKRPQPKPKPLPEDRYELWEK
ncbi:hypothetical protein [Variovorax sp. PAMC26660]|uniref:hypothetical protein n=1 Tax=Variovorax sp. PAMC26660 TaxID=2762322 RepID=UPI00164EBCE5|nr:hypothetical protein [Variovorax sp. PAMC26660]QNK68318.1 hypothetical protein H7F35_00780 [Variovorax sp. PAMC26660]